MKHKYSQNTLAHTPLRYARPPTLGGQFHSDYLRHPAPAYGQAGWRSSPKVGEVPVRAEGYKTNRTTPKNLQGV